MTTESPVPGAFGFGELVHLVDGKNRKYLLTLEEGGSFQTHAGFLDHADLVGKNEGREVKTSKGQTFRAFRPTLSDFIFSMPRGAQVIYPKDIGPILMMADIRPGCRVLESGVGSGALSMGMLNCGATIVGYELREDFAGRAKNNVKRFLGAEILDRYLVEVRDCYEGIDEVGLDRVVLDLPEPWHVPPHAAQALKPGGIFLSYSPSITQSVQTTAALAQSGFSLIKTTEVLHRGWNIAGTSVRPDHRMVAHTGFLTQARLLDQRT